MIERLLLILLPLPPSHREAMLGDLLEEHGDAPADRLRALAATVLRYQLEPYRGPGGIERPALLLALGLGLILGVREVAWSAAAVPDGYDPVSRLALHLWTTPHVVSALAAGVLAGHVGSLAPAAEIGRRHVVVTLACAAGLAAPDTTAGLATALLLVGAAVLGRAGRRPTGPTASRASTRRAPPTS